MKKTLKMGLGLPIVLHPKKKYRQSWEMPAPLPITNVFAAYWTAASIQIARTLSSVSLSFFANAEFQKEDSLQIFFICSPLMCWTGNPFS